MDRSTKDAWLQGPGDLKEAVVEDVPYPGQSVRVRELAAAFSSRAGQEAAQMIVDARGQQMVRVDHARLEVLTFVYGCVDPSFTEQEAEIVAKKYRAAFEKVVEKIQELSNINPDEIKDVEARFQPLSGGEGRPDVGDAGPVGGDGPVEPVRVGAGVPDAD